MRKPTAPRALDNENDNESPWGSGMSPLADRKTRLAYNRALRSKGVPAKACGNCFAVKAHGQFPEKAASPDGRQAACRVCKREINAAWCTANADRQRETNAAWRAANADRKRETNAAWRAANADRVRENSAAWYAANPDRKREIDARRRARKASVPHQPYDRAELFARWDHECCYCSAPATDVEHILPISKGGADALHNLTIACQPCNSSKGAKTLAEWALTF